MRVQIACPLRLLQYQEAFQHLPTSPYFVGDPAAYLSGAFAESEPRLLYPCPRLRNVDSFIHLEDSNPDRPQGHICFGLAAAISEIRPPNGLVVHVEPLRGVVGKVPPPAVPGCGTTMNDSQRPEKRARQADGSAETSDKEQTGQSRSSRACLNCRRHKVRLPSSAPPHFGDR